MGNFRHTIAKVQLGGSELAIVVSIVVCCVLLLLCTVGKSWRGWWMCICCGNGCSRCGGDKCNSGAAASCTCFISPGGTKTQLFLLMATPSVCRLVCIPGLIVCARHVFEGRGLKFACSETCSDYGRNPFFFAAEIPVHAKILNRNNLLHAVAGRRARSALSPCLRPILNFIATWRAVIVWLRVVFHSSRRVLHKEPKGGALLAENAASDGGDGVPDQRGDP